MKHFLVSLDYPHKNHAIATAPGPKIAHQVDRLLHQSDAHFARLANQYHAVNRQAHRAETNVEPTTDDHLTQIRKERMALKESIYSYLSNE